MVKAILFDFWGTLVEQGVKSPLRQVQIILNLRLPFPEYVVRMEKAMMTASFGELREAFQAVCTEFGFQSTSQQMEQLIGMCNKSWMLAKPYPETKEVLEQLRKNYLLVLISNTDCFSLSKVLEKYDLKEFFTQRFLSYKIGLLKTDPAFIEQVLQKLELPASECLWVGDSMESDMKAAKQSSMRSILIDRRNSREYPAKIASLRELEEQL